MDDSQNLTGNREECFDKRYLFVAAGYCLAIALIFYPTVESMVTIWWRSETFTHGFLVAPIVIWLIWEKRQELARLYPSCQYRALIPLLSCGFLWLFGQVMDAAVVQQIALIGILLSGLWVILGTSVVWAIAFPLAFLFLAVPVGEGLIPVLMEFTADFTVGLLKITGIPVYREGLFFTLPSGNWSVVEGCSGVRYLIASVTLGCLFAYLSYQSLLKRGLFIAASFVVPVIANGLRAYMIVMIGHLSSMKLATGVDHLIYGWVFFGLVMFVLFAVGSIWRDHDAVEQGAAVTQEKGLSQQTRVSPYISAVVVLSLAGIWPYGAYLMETQYSLKAMAPLAAPQGRDGWVPNDSEAWRWRPVVKGADGEFHQFYHRDGSTVSIYAGQYLTQNQNKELINSQNVFVVQKSPDWRVTGRKTVALNLGGNVVEVDQARIKGSGSDLLALRWYRLGDKYTANPYIGKLLGGLAKLTFARRDGAYITVSTRVDDEEALAFDTLQNFMNTMLPGLESQLDRVVGVDLESADLEGNSLERNGLE
ncbi:MAG: exosortase A [Gammaproteobacteria bacterium]|nr:exosortase A [Gammaproteobacteria bacterium]MBQ0840790.1 exosortase A [Gammaproteobacteria bacterium]